MSLAGSKRTRTKVQCFCIKCNGTLVDPRTKKSHMSRRIINYQEAGPSWLPDEMDDIEMDDNGTDDEMDDDNEMDGNEMDDNEMDDNEMDDNEIDDNEMEYPLHIFLTKKLPINKSAKYQKVKKGRISDRVLEHLLSDDDNDDLSGNSDNDQVIDLEESEDEDFENDDYEVVNFASPDFNDDEPKLPPNLINDSFTWIILWIFQFQQRYKLSNVAIDSLFKFLSLFLSTVDANKFKSFPSSLHMAKKKLGIPTGIGIVQYGACNKCHKLYDINEMLNKTEIPSCSFLNYPNHSMEKFRQKCNNPLIKKIDSSIDNPIFRPIMTFPLVNIRQLLTLFFGRKDFEMSCRKWAERKNETEALFDIYDGVIWKEFKDDNDELFFKKEYADTHIGLMLNMDWFQPFINSQYSVGAIYAVICNLPRADRFKPQNILTLAVIPGPHEPKLHEINNYLYPIVNQLNQLWNGYNIITHEGNNGRFV